MKKIKRIYFNAVQIAFVTALHKIKTLVAGRGFGKSTLISLILRVLLKEMPRAKGFFSSTTVEQVKNSTLPPVIEKLAKMGIHEDKHFVVGKDPWKNPKTSWFARPISPVKKFDNVITFWNGLTIVILSAAKPKSQRGGSYDFGIVDEAAFVKRSFFETVLLKMLRGNLYRFTSHLHHSLFILTSQPRTSEGMWVLEFEDKAKMEPDKYLFVWASAYHNKVVLGKEWFKTQKSTSSPLDYMVEVENQRLKKLPDGFYPAYEEKRHAQKVGRTMFGQYNDVRPDELLEVSFDFSGKFNCASVWQEQDFVERCLHQFHVKDEGKIKAVVDKVCHHFKTHEFKYVRLWGDPRGRDRNAIDEEIFTIILNRFKEKGWDGEICVPAGLRTQAHKERYEFMETLMTEDNPLLPVMRLNQDTCPNVMISLQSTDIMPDFSKNKKAEKDPNFPQENAPHYSDTVDYYLYYKHGWRLNDDSNRRAGRAEMI